MAEHAGETGPPILPEDLLLLLFQPAPTPGGTGVIAGESTLDFTLAGALLTDLGLGGHVRTAPGPDGSPRVEAVADRPPGDDLLWLGWNCLMVQPRSIPVAFTSFAPSLRRLVQRRIIKRGDVRPAGGTALDPAGALVLRDGRTGRRARLLSGVRDVLVDGVQPHPRVAALTALIWASGSLPSFAPEIPLTPSVVARARQLEESDWGARAAAEAIAGFGAATIVTNILVAAAMFARGESTLP